MGILFKNESYQNIVLEKIEKYRKSSTRIALMDFKNCLLNLLFKEILMNVSIDVEDDRKKTKSMHG